MNRRDAFTWIEPPYGRIGTIERGFTLVELLVVVAIIALLLGILLPALQGARDVAKQVVCMNNMNQASKALIMYADDNDGFVPPKTVTVPDRSSGGRGGPSAGETFTTVFSWMGKTGVEGGYLEGLTADARPLNRYLTGSGVPAPDAEIPVAECPSDNGFGILSADSFYDSVGTSYSSSTAANPDWNDMLIFDEETGEQRPAQLFSIPHPSRMVTMAEHGAHNRAWGEDGGFFESTVWWHREEHFYVMAFADGHADYNFVEFNVRWTPQYKFVQEKPEERRGSGGRG